MSLFREPCAVKAASTVLTGGLGRRTARQRALILPTPCTTAVRDLEAPRPAYQGRGRPPKPSWQSVTVWRHALDPAAWAHVTVRDGE